MADYVKCIYCNKEFFVRTGQDECPVCKDETLIWADPENQEVEVSDSLYYDMINEKAVEVDDDIKKSYFPV